jgi:hypothetical protein
MALLARSFVCPALLFLLGIACGSDPVRKPPSAAGAANSAGRSGNAGAANNAGNANGAGGASEAGPESVPTTTLEVPVSATKTTYVNLGTPAVVPVTDPTQSTGWDLALVGYDVFTNGGLSGPGNGSAFGPLPVVIAGFPDQPVSVPFLIQDYSGGAFLDWYGYDSSTHHIYSRYHIYGVRSGGRLYKLQILDYYGGPGDMPTSAFYQLRYAEVTASGSGDTSEIHDLDATFDGAAPGPDVPTACLRLETGETSMLSPNDAASSKAWDLCFRRDNVSVNGGVSGPGDVTAVDLDLANFATETLSDIEMRTADSEQPRFDGIDSAALEAPDLDYRSDSVLSAFTGQWVDQSTDPPAPLPGSAFLVVGADGSSRYLVAFDAFDGASANTPGTIELSVAPSVSP